MTSTAARRTDARVSPWKGTVWGAVQAVNTHAHHGGTVRNVPRPERNMLRVVSGGIDTLDAGSEALARRVLAGQVA